MPITGTFPSQAELDRVAREYELFALFTGKDVDTDRKSDRWKFRLKEFFEGDEQKAKLLDVALNVASTCVQAGTDFLLSEPPKIEAVENEDAQKVIDAIIERNSLIRRLAESCDLAQAVGHTHFKLYSQNSEAFIEEVPYLYCYPDWSGAPHGGEPRGYRFASYLTAENGNVTEKYILVEDRRMESGKLVIEWGLYEDQGGKIGNQVELSKLGIVRDGTPSGLSVIQQTEFEDLMVVSLNMRKTTLDRYGRSTLENVKPLLRELNDRLTQISLQFLKHLNAKIQMPSGTVVRERDGSIKAQKIEVILMEQGMPDAKYVTNDNPLIEQAFEHIEKVIRKICKLTQTPDSFLTEDEKGGVEKAESLKVRLMAFLKRVRFLQSVYDEAIRKIMQLALTIEGKSDVKIKTTFDPGLPKDWEVDGRVWGDAKAAGLASRRTAVMKFQGIDGEALDEEIAAIEDEEKALQESLLAMNEPTEDDPPPKE